MYPAMLSYTSAQKKLSLENLVSLLEYTGVVLTLWERECDAISYSDRPHEVIRPTEILAERADEIVEFYISRAVDCGSNLPTEVFRCDNMRDIKRLYLGIWESLGRPKLDAIFQRYTPTTGVSLAAAQRFLNMI